MEAQEIGRGIYAVLAPEGLGNAGFIVAEAGVIVVDTMMTPTMARELLEIIGKNSSKMIRFVVNTHHHGDHTFGNQFFPQAVIVGHEGVRARMAELGDTMIAQSLRSRPHLKEEFQQVKVTMPALTFSQRFTFHWGGERVELFHLGKGHTPGDSVVYLPQQKALFAGDLLFTRCIPAVQPDGDSRGWIEALSHLISLPLDRVVPGHGPVSTADDLKIQQEYLLRLRQEVERCCSRGMSKEETGKAVTMSAYATYEHQERIPGNVAVVYDELTRPKA